MSPSRRYLIIALIIMVIVMLWVSRGQDGQVAPTALPVNGMIEEGQETTETEVMPPESAPAIDNMDTSAPPAMDSSMPAPADTPEVDGVPQGTEVSGEAPAPVADMPAPAQEAPMAPPVDENQPLLPGGGGQ